MNQNQPRRVRTVVTNSVVSRVPRRQRRRRNNNNSVPNLVRTFRNTTIAPVQQQRRPRRRRNLNRRQNIGIQERLIQKGHEFYGVITVPAASKIGDNLFQVEVNPSMIPRLSVISSQYKQWKGDVKMHVESLGNAFSLSSVSAAFFPDPNPNHLPPDPTDLLRAIDSAPSKKTVHLQDPSLKTVDAAWSLSTNPWKFTSDTDASDRSNGLFLIIANGTPGTDPVNLKISFSYNVTFQGNTYQPMVVKPGPPPPPPPPTDPTVYDFVYNDPITVTVDTCPHPAFDKPLLPGQTVVCDRPIFLNSWTDATAFDPPSSGALFQAGTTFGVPTPTTSDPARIQWTLITTGSETYSIAFLNPGTTSILPFWVTGATVFEVTAD